MADLHNEDRARRLMQAGRDERPSSSLLERTLSTLQAQTGAASAERLGWWQRMRQALAPRYWVPVVSAVALAGLGLSVVSGPSVFPGAPSLRAEASSPQIVADRFEPAAPFIEPSANTRRMPPELTPSVANALPPAEPPVSPTGMAEPAPAPAPVAAPAEATRALRGPSASEVAARQKLQNARRDFAAAAARAQARTPAHGPCVPRVCDAVRPTDALVTDFEDVSDEGVFVDGDAYSKKPEDWWQRFYGSAYIYPESGGQTAPPSGLKQSTRGLWRVRGKVDDWAGFGLWLGSCQVDLSGYRGISFKLWGQAGPSGAVTLQMETHENAPPEKCRTNVGGCDKARGECVAPSKRLSVPSEPGEAIVVLWNDLRGGAPRATPDPKAIIQWHWSFDWRADDTLDPYQVDVRIDDVRLVH